MVMGSRKAAPALRARPLRSYVPLRRVPSESELSGTIPGLPGCVSTPTISDSKKKRRQTFSGKKVRRSGRQY